MKNSEIKYELSTDYGRLYDLLKNGITVIGFIALNIDGVANDEYSKVTTMSYNAKHKMFDLGFVFFEVDFDEPKFYLLCERENVRFIDIV